MVSTSYGLSIRTDSPECTGDISRVSSLDEDWVLMNQMIKYRKFGFGKTTEYINEEIRKGNISQKMRSRSWKNMMGSVRINTFRIFVII